MPFAHKATMGSKYFYQRVITKLIEQESVVGPVIQANGRMTLEDDLRSGGLLCFSVRTGLANSMVILGESGDA